MEGSDRQRQRHGGNLTGQVRNIAEVTTAVALGDLSKKITVDVKGEILELKNTINTMVDQLNSFASEVTRVAREVGTEGKLGGQAQVRGVAGTWKDLTDNVNLMADNLTGQVRNIADVTTAVARGDLSKKITVDVKGEILALKNTINTMVDQLNGFASEVTRVAREVGTEGKLGGQAKVPGVGGTWKDLTDNVNLMATNLTNQVRGIAEVVTAVAQGNLKRKLTVDAKGEIAALAETINFMIETLSTFGDQVTNMAREVGIEGRLGGQARVPGAAGLWRDLTDNVNQLAANLTNQVRSIADVATAVTKGDLTRSIAVEASGEMAALKDNINEMIRNLKDQTLKNAEQDWLKTNLARFSPHAAGRARPGDRVEPHHVRARAAGERAIWRVLRLQPRRGRDQARAGRELRRRKPRRAQARVRAARRADRPGGGGQAANAAQGRAARLPPGPLGPRQGDSAQRQHPARSVRGRGQGGHRARLVQRVQRDPPKLPRPADGIGRYRSQYHRRDDAHRGPAQAITAAHPGAAGAADRADHQAGRAAQHQRGAAGESAAA